MTTKKQGKTKPVPHELNSHRINNNFFLFIRLSYTIFPCWYFEWEKQDVYGDRERERETSKKKVFKKIGLVCFIYWSYFAMLNVNSNEHIKILDCDFIFSSMHVLIRQTYLYAYSEWWEPTGEISRLEKCQRKREYHVPIKREFFLFLGASILEFRILNLNQSNRH